MLKGKRKEWGGWEGWIGAISYNYASPCPEARGGFLKYNLDCLGQSNMLVHSHTVKRETHTGRRLRGDQWFSITQHLGQNAMYILDPETPTPQVNLRQWKVGEEHT